MFPPPPPGKEIVVPLTLAGPSMAACQPNENPLLLYARKNARPGTITAAGAVIDTDGKPDVNSVVVNEYCRYSSVDERGAVFTNGAKPNATGPAPAVTCAVEKQPVDELIVALDV